MDDLYDMVKDNTALRKKKAEEYGIRFEIPSAVSFVPNVPKKQRKLKQPNAAYLIGKARERLVGERGFEPPTPWSRTRFHRLVKAVEIC